MRRALPLFLSLLLVCAQSAGLLHAIGHAAAGHVTAGHSAAVGVPPVARAAPGAAAAADAQAPAGPESSGGRCDKCFEFAHFSSSTAPLAPLVVLAQTVSERSAGPQVALLARDAPVSRSRGPPYTL